MVEFVDENGGGPEPKSHATGLLRALPDGPPSLLPVAASLAALQGHVLIDKLTIAGVWAGSGGDSHKQSGSSHIAI